MRGSGGTSASSKRQDFLSPLSILILIGIGFRIFLLNWYRGEYTDGIIQLQLFENSNTYFPPLYPLLVNWIQAVIGDPVLSGRFVSLLASTLVLIPLYHLTRRLFGPRAALWAGIFYLVSAVPNRWALRVMSDSLFTLFFSTAVMAFVFSLGEPPVSKRPISPVSQASQLSKALAQVRLRRWLFLLVGSAGLATLSRYQGLALVPLIGYSAWRNRRGFNRWEIVETALSLLPWVLLVYWIRRRGFGHPAQFEGRVHESFGLTLLAYWDMAETFLLYLPYALTIPVFAMILMGFFSKKSFDLHRITRGVLLYLLVVWLPVHAAFQSFQYRYFLPLIPLGLVFAGQGMVRLQDWIGQKRLLWSRILGCVVVGQSLFFAAAVLIFQRNAFADFTEIGRMIAAGRFDDGRIFAAEMYNPGNNNIKLSYWGGKEIPYCGSSRPGEDLFKEDIFKPGDYVVISNAYTPLDAARLELVQEYEFDVAARSEYYRLTPLLPDIMVDPPGATSQPRCMAYRYYQQVYFSYVLRITGIRGRGSERFSPPH